MNLTPEAHALLLTAGGQKNDDALRGAVAGGLDWSLLLSLARREKAEGVLWRRLQHCGAEGVPADVAADLKRLALVREFRQRCFQDRLGEALEVLGAAGIDVLLIKGAGLAHTVYAGFTERPMGDLDLLVEPARAPEAQARLQEAGWLPDQSTPLDHHYDAHQHLRPLRDPGETGVWLELHRELLPLNAPFRMLADHLWSESQPVPGLGPHVRAPGLRHHILYACLHLAWAHRLAWGAWTTFRDLDAILARFDDWDAIVDDAREAGASTYCYWVFRLARSTARVPIPAGPLDALRPARPEPVLRLLERHFALGLLPDLEICPSARMTTALWSFGMGTTRGRRHRGAEPSPFLRGVPDRGVAKVRGHLQRSGAWKRYLLAMLR